MEVELVNDVGGAVLVGPFTVVIDSAELDRSRRG